VVAALGTVTGNRGRVSRMWGVMSVLKRLLVRRVQWLHGKFVASILTRKSETFMP
jgi:hypothetical protein